MFAPFLMLIIFMVAVWPLRRKFLAALVAQYRPRGRTGRFEIVLWLVSMATRPGCLRLCLLSVDYRWHFFSEPLYVILKDVVVELTTRSVTPRRVYTIQQNRTPDCPVLPSQRED